jgi:hypothetical protein
MKYYIVCAANDGESDWLLYELPPAPAPLRVRNEYQDLVCGQCGKLDEYVALKRHVSPRFRIRMRTDWTASADEIYCVSRRIVDLIRVNKISGVEFFKLPSQTDRFVMMPSLFVPVDLSHTEMKFFGQCPQCRRYRETTGWPGLTEMQIPRDPLAIFSPDVRLESVCGMRMLFVTSERVRTIFEAARISGVGWFEL